MSTTVPPRDGDGLTSPSPRPLLADEDALRRVFTGEFPVLLADARARLGDGGALAPRVVEGAFVRAWHERGRFHTQEELHGFLVQDVHERAARALSRRAVAHRMGGLSGTASDAPTTHSHSDVPTAEVSWEHVSRAIHTESHSASALAEAAEVSRHDAAEHVKAIARPTAWRVPAAVGGAALVVTIGGMTWMDRISLDAAAARAVNAADARAVTTIPGQLAVVTLDDGTRARLAPETRLAIPKGFGTRFRAVKVEGAATFDVAPASRGAFQVHVGDAVATATGTAFTVRSYAGDDAALVSVREGTVTVRSRGGERALSAGQSAVVEHAEAPRAATASEAEEVASWTGGRMAIVQRPLREVLPQLRRWYDADVKVVDESLLARPITVRASLDSLSAAIREIERSGGLRLGHVAQQMVFVDAGASKSPAGGSPAPARSGKR